MTYKASKLWLWFSDLYCNQSLFLELLGVLNNLSFFFSYLKSIVDLFCRDRQTYSDTNPEQYTFMVEHHVMTLNWKMLTSKYFAFLLKLAVK